MISSTITLQTTRLVLRRVSESDIPFVFSASRYPGFCDGMQWEPPVSQNQLLEPLEASLAAWESGDAYTFTIDLKPDMHPMGRICIRRQACDSWNIGFWTHPKFQRCGIMTEAASKILEFGFTTLDASAIQGTHATWNHSSARVLKKIGMHFYEHLPQGFQKKGQWVAEDLLQITRQEWQQRKTEQGAAANP